MCSPFEFLLTQEFRENYIKGNKENSIYRSMAKWTPKYMFILHSTLMTWWYHLFHKLQEIVPEDQLGNISVPPNFSLFLFFTLSCQEYIFVLLQHCCRLIAIISNKNPLIHTPLHSLSLLLVSIVFLWALLNRKHLKVLISRLSVCLDECPAGDENGNRPIPSGPTLSPL